MNKKRIFTFGCSFTAYCWPTWADMLLYENYGKNYGISGGGFDQILSKLVQCDIDYNLTFDDIVIIVYPNLVRWDGPFYPNMANYGNALTSDLSEYQDKLWTIEGLVYKNSNIIYIIDEFLQNKKVIYQYSAIFDIFSNYGNYYESISIDDNLKNYINKIEKKIKLLTTFSEFTNNEDEWRITKQWKELGDQHPRPLTHYKWLNEILLPTINVDINITKEMVNEMETRINNFEYINDSQHFFKQEKYFENRDFFKIN